MKLTVKSGSATDREVEVTPGEFLIGRDDDCQLTLDDEQVSRRHALVAGTADGGFEIEDLGSRNGVLVNGKAITGRVQLNDGDQLELGDTSLEVSIPPPGPVETAAYPGPGSTKVASDQGATKIASTPGATKIASSPGPVLVGISGPGEGKRVTPTTEGIKVGRDADVSIDDDEVSRLHALARLTDEGTVEIRDLGSSNGTFVNGKPIEGSVRLLPDDEVRIGQTRFALEGVVQAKTTGTTNGMSRNRLIAVAAGGLAVVVVLVLLVTVVLSGDDDEEGPLTANQVIEKASPSTVLVEATGTNGVGGGTGWVYDADDGLIVTNAHVVAGGNRFRIGVGDEMRGATVEGVAPCSDLALLRTNKQAGLVNLPLGSQSELEQGDDVFVIGYPGSLSLDDPLQVTQGIASVVQTRLDAAGQVQADAIVMPNVVQTDASINSGNSGGPTLNDRAELIGVSTAATVGKENQGYAIGVDEVKKVIPVLAKGDSIGWAGFSSSPVALGGDDNRFLQVVDEVVPRTDADQIGLRPGDAILSIGGQEIDTSQDYCRAVENIDSGETVAIEVLRPGTNGTRRVPITFE